MDHLLCGFMIYEQQINSLSTLHIIQAVMVYMHNLTSAAKTRVAEVSETPESSSQLLDSFLLCPVG